MAVAEQHSQVVQCYDARSGACRTTIKAPAVPLALAHVPEQQSLLVACSDMTMSQWVLTGVNNRVTFKEKARWPTPDTIMCLCWAPAQRLAFSGSTSGVVHGWDIELREARMALEGHTDIVMAVLHIPYLDNVVSASLDRTVRVWDTYTRSVVIQVIEACRRCFLGERREETRRCRPVQF